MKVFENIKLTNIESLNIYPRAERISMVINLMEGKGTIYKYGKEVDADNIGTDIWRLIDALNAAEDQIEQLRKIVNELELDETHFDDYLEDYPEDQNYSQKYRLDEAKARVHHCMRGGKDEKHLNKAINQYNLIAEKGGEQ